MNRPKSTSSKARPTQPPPPPVSKPQLAKGAQPPVSTKQAVPDQQPVTNPPSENKSQAPASIKQPVTNPPSENKSQAPASIKQPVTNPPSENKSQAPASTQQAVTNPPFEKGAHTPASTQRPIHNPSPSNGPHTPPDTPPPPPPPVHKRPNDRNDGAHTPDISDSPLPPPPADMGPLDIESGHSQDMLSDTPKNPVHKSNFNNESKQSLTGNTHMDKTHEQSNMNEDKQCRTNNMDKNKLDIASKPRTPSTSSSEAGGKSPRSNFRKSRPAPPPPKPLHKLSNLTVNSAMSSKSSLDSASKSSEHLNMEGGGSSRNITISGDNGRIQSRLASVTSSNGLSASDQNIIASSSPRSTPKSPATKTPQHHHSKKSIIKPCAPPPQPPTPKAHNQSATNAAHPAQSSCDDPGGGNHIANTGSSNGNHCKSHSNTKPAISLPKPKIKPIVAPPPPPSPKSQATPSQYKSEPIARNGNSAALGSQANKTNDSCGSQIEDNSHHGNKDNGCHVNIYRCEAAKADEEKQSVGESMSDLMREVLGVIDSGAKGSSVGVSATAESKDREELSHLTEGTVDIGNMLDSSGQGDTQVISELQRNQNVSATTDTSHNESKQDPEKPQIVLAHGHSKDDDVTLSSQSVNDAKTPEVNIEGGKPSPDKTPAPLQALSIQIDSHPEPEVKTDKSQQQQHSTQSSPGSHSQYSPSHKSHGRSKGSRVRRKHSALGLMLCCGLGRAYMRDKNSPPFELPMRTEGTLPKGNNVVNSTSLPTVLVPAAASNSPKKLEQSDVSHGQTNNINKDDVSIKTKEVDNENDPICNPTQPIVVAIGDKSDNSCSIKDHVTSDKPDPPTSGLDNTENEIPARNKQNDIIDVLCAASEKPIAINKLQGDNKDLVMNQNRDFTKSASPSPSGTTVVVDITAPPVVHGVKLVERSSTFSNSGQNNGHLMRAGTPRLSNTHLNVSTTVSSSHSSHTDISSSDPPRSQEPNSITIATGPVPPPSNDQAPVPLRKDSQSGSTPTSRDPAKVRSQSMEDLTSIDLTSIAVDLDLLGQFKRGNDAEGYRSSFIGEEATSRPALTRAPGEVQTLLKHGKEGDSGVYALPQPACYGDNTLRAVKLIRDKYDTLERWKICATSFRGDQTTRKSSSGGAQKVAFQTAPLSPSRQASRESNKSDVIMETASDVIDGNMKRQKSVTMSSPSDEPLIDSNHETDSNSIPQTPVPNPYDLSPAEISRIKLFYSSRDTHVEVATCVVDFLLSATEAQKAKDVKAWTHAQTGVPTLVLTTGEGRGRRQLQLILSDRHTSFPLWSDTINHLSQYGCHGDTRHTLHLSSSLMKMAALEFPHSAAASGFMTQFAQLTADTNDDLWKVCIATHGNAVAKGKKHKKGQVAGLSSNHKGIMPLKACISQPIQFDHVTNLTSRDPCLGDNLASFVGVAKDELGGETT